MQYNNDCADFYNDFSVDTLFSFSNQVNGLLLFFRQSLSLTEEFMDLCLNVHLLNNVKFLQVLLFFFVTMFEIFSANKCQEKCNRSAKKGKMLFCFCNNTCKYD